MEWKVRMRALQFLETFPRKINKVEENLQILGLVALRDLIKICFKGKMEKMDFPSSPFLINDNLCIQYLFILKIFFI